MTADATRSDTTMTPLGAVVETIDTYDADAEIYGGRFSNVDFGPYLEKFVSALPLRTPVLDAGCGSGRDLAWLVARGVTAVGLDRSRGMLAVARRTSSGVGLVQADLRCLPFGSATFGGVWHCASLLHLAPEDAVTALSEVWRVLVPNGALFLSVASGHSTEWREGASGRRWFHYYDKTELEDLLEKVSIEVLSSATEPGVVRGTWVNILAKKRS